MLLDMLAL
jgi:hypothetical protein